jgi:hypothetical protein
MTADDLSLKQTDLLCKLTINLRAIFGAANLANLGHYKCQIMFGCQTHLKYHF